MAEKKEGGNIKNIVVNALSAHITPMLKEGLKGLLKKLQDAVHHTEKKIIEKLAAAVILLIGFIFISVGLAFFINDYFMVERYWGFLFVGLMLMIIAYLLRKYAERTKYCKME